MERTKNTETALGILIVLLWGVGIYFWGWKSLYITVPAYPVIMFLIGLVSGFLELRN